MNNDFTIRARGSEYVIINRKTWQEWGFTIEYLKESDMRTIASNLVNPKITIHPNLIPKMQALVWFHNWIKENKPEELI